MSQSETNKIDIFDIINKVKNNDREYFNNLGLNEMKRIPWLMVMKWLASTKNKNQILLINELVNTTIFSFYDHPELTEMLMEISSISKDRLTWIKRPSKTKNSVKLNVIKSYYDCTLSEAVKYLPLLNNDDIIYMAEIVGLEKEIFDKLKKELNGK